MKLDEKIYWILAYHLADCCSSEIDFTEIKPHFKTLELFPSKLQHLYDGTPGYFDEEANRFGIALMETAEDLNRTFGTNVLLDYDARTEFQNFPTVHAAFAYLYDLILRETDLNPDAEY